VAQGLHALLWGLCSEEVSEALHLCEVQAVVVEGPARKLAGLGQRQAREAGQGVQDPRDHRRAAVQVQLHQVLCSSRELKRSRERERERDG
jgi:hypothetical protein